MRSASHVRRVPIIGTVFRGLRTLSFVGAGELICDRFADVEHGGSATALSA